MTIGNFNFENVGQGHEDNFHNGAIRWQLAKSLKVAFHVFEQALTVFEILNLKYLTLRKVGQGYAVLHSKWCHSMTKIKIYKSRVTYSTLTVLEIFTCKIFYLEKNRSRSRSTTFAMAPFDGKYQNLHINI